MIGEVIFLSEAVLHREWIVKAEKEWVHREGAANENCLPLVIEGGAIYKLVSEIGAIRAYGLDTRNNNKRLVWKDIQGEHEELRLDKREK